MKGTDYSSGPDGERMQMAVKYYRDQGGFDSENKPKKDDYGFFLVKPDSVAKMFNVDRVSFRNRLEGKLKQEKRGRSSLFSDDEEKFLLDLIKLRALVGRPMGLEDLKTTAKDLLIAKRDKALSDPNIDPETLQQLRDKMISPPGNWWGYNFLKRFDDEIGKRIGKMMSKNRATAMSREKPDDYYDLLEYIIGKTNLDDLSKRAKIIYNCDKTGICLRPKQVKFIMPRGMRNAYSVSERSTYQYTTVHACGNAAGDVLTPMIIYRNLPQIIPEKFMSWKGPLYKTNKKGWMRTDLFIEWFTTIFIPESAKLKPEDYDGPIILLYDGCSSHLSDDLIKIAQKHKDPYIEISKSCDSSFATIGLNIFRPFEKHFRSDNTRKSDIKSTHGSWQRRVR